MPASSPATSNRGRGVEHVTIDHEGYVFWRGIQLEHYCTRRMTPERQQAATDELARRCRIAEGRGLTVSPTNVIWHWIDQAAATATAAVRQNVDLASECLVEL
jgi:hypothetical protein